MKRGICSFACIMLLMAFVGCSVEESDKLPDSPSQERPEEGDDDSKDEEDEEGEEGEEENNEPKVEELVFDIKADNPLLYGSGGEISLPVSKGWEVSVVDADSNAWVELSHENDMLKVRTLPNDTNSERESMLCFKCGDVTQYLPIKQFPNIVRREPIDERRVRNTLSVAYEAATLTSVIAVLPVPVSNLYQDVSNLEYDAGEVRIAHDGDTPYLYRYIGDSRMIPASMEPWLSEVFSITNYRVYVDFDAITSYVDIDKESLPYKKHTGKSGDIIDPYHPEIVSLAEQLWKQSDGDIIDYARLSYEWVAANMSYLNPNTGLHPLADILANGGGDCGNQATVFISLMRCKEIPARHVVMVRTDGTFHVRSEFYLAGYGWIPVDVNAKNMMPLGDFFGKVETNEIVVNNNINIVLDLDGLGLTNIVILQNFAAWYWWSRETSVEFYHTVTEI